MCTRRPPTSIALPTRLLPGDLHPEEVHEHLARRLVPGILLRAADVEIDLLRRRVRFSARQLLPRQRIVDPQRLPVAQALRDHEVHLVILIERLSVSRGAAKSPAGEEADGLRPVVVAATRVGAMFVDVGDDAAVLAGAEFVPALQRQDEIAFRNLQARLERAGVLYFVDVDLRGAADRLDGLGVVVEMIPTLRIVEAAD